MIIEDLWSEREQEAARRLVVALEHENLARALLAVEGVDETDARECVSRLRAWAAAVDAEAGDSLELQAEALAELLAQRLGFKGDRDDYYHPRNSALSRVITRRRGLPILLSSVWIVVGREAGLQVEGVGMPGHFIARVGGRDGILVDPFHEGVVLTEEQCRAIVARLGGRYLDWRDEFLEPASLGAIVERVLNNLAGAYSRRDDFVGAYRALALQAEARPQSASARLRLGRVAERLGALRLAARHYDDIIDDFEGTVAAEKAAERKAKLGPFGSLN